MTEGTERAAFTWRDYEQRGFDELEALLGEGWELVQNEGDPEAEAFFEGRHIGNVLAIDPFHVELCLGPGECTYIDPEDWNESCLSVALLDDPFPDDVNPVDLEAAAAVLLGAVG